RLLSNARRRFLQRNRGQNQLYTEAGPLLRSAPEELTHAAGSGMDILGIGTEIVECLRIGRMIERHGELFLTRVYTDREIRYCQARKRATEHFAGRWAAKEAVFKCLGSGWKRGLCATDLEIRKDPNGNPCLLLCV